jgi:photosystem II stability/assembly factor-like uncharacterized protein
MSDDELVERLRRTLTTEAAHVTAPDDAWERFQAARPVPLRQPERRRLWVGVPAGVVGLAAAIVVAVIVTRGGGSKGSEVASRPVTAAAPTTAAASAAAGAQSATPSAGASPTTPTFAQPAGGPVPSGFQAASVTFVSPSDGWVLGTAPCASAPCTSVLHTTDGGHTWVGIPAPKAPLAVDGSAQSGVSVLRFADANDGWAFGPDLWATHDGGRTWHKVTVPGSDGRVYALEAAAGTVHVAVFDAGGFRVATAPVGSDALAETGASVPVGAGPVPTVQLVVQGNTGWLLEVDRTVVGGLKLVNGAWQSWTPPCATANGPALLAASSPSDLVAACDQGIWGPATPMGERLWLSHDGGSTFTDAGASPLNALQAVASPSPGVVVAAGSASIEATFDGGRTWSEVLLTGGGGVTDLGFTTTTQGVAVLHPPGQAGILETTHDGGHTWAEVAFS